MSKNLFLKPFKPQSSRGVRTSCEICDIKFQLIVRQEHQCKRCLRAICEKCGPVRSKVYKPDGTIGVHRNCIVCLKEV